MERSLTKAIQFCLLLLALSAPISIAATQTAWALALLFWLIRAFFVRPSLPRQAFDIAVIVFLGLTLLSSILSYEQEVSLRKMVAVSLVTIAYLVTGFLSTRKLRRTAIALLIVAGAFSVLFTLGKLAVGKHLQAVRLTPDSPLRAAGVEDGYTILAANGIEVNSPEELLAAINKDDSQTAAITVYRYELVDTYSLNKTDIPPRVEGLGILEWSRSREMRASGFFGHYTTYAEALQLILSLAFGLLVASAGGRLRILIGCVIALLGVALFLTVTRASWAGFALSAAVMVLIGTTRRTVLICVALAIPLMIAGLFYLQQKRNIGIIDMNAGGSTSWRTTVWREGFDLLISDPRHLAVGIGMDSIKTHYLEWGMFDNGKLPVGHMHSTPLQFALERGIPALIAWVIWMFIYLKLLWRGLKNKNLEWPERGLLLGAFGGAIGFFASGLVHYNWGDSEVVMVFYLIMGLSLTIIRLASVSDVSSPHVSKGSVAAEAITSERAIIGR